MQSSFLDASNNRRSASPEVLSSVLKALGVPANNEKEIRDSLRASRLGPYQRGIEPVAVAWEGRETKVLFHVPESLVGKRMQ
ncbi:MAG TPA: hypothetical protein VGI88_02270, partial [Verrucomicrobiae bacterium]